MHAMQYELTLPADYDMQVIRTRVKTTGHLLDDRPGLALKAYLIRQRGVDGSPVNQYAPFYLWTDPGAMGLFLLGGGGFQNIVRDFGRPSVSHWTGIASVSGRSRAFPARSASRRLVALEQPTGTDAAAGIAGELAALERLAAHPHLHTAALAFDPSRWQLVRFAVWGGEVPQDETAGERYEVLHLATPELAQLPDGRHW